MAQDHPLLSIPCADRLRQQLGFIIEIDKLKLIFRQTVLMDASRYENDAEHSWHLAMMVLCLGEYAEGDVDLLRVLKMVLIHDIVEIDAGDTFCYDEVGRQSQRQREQEAADRLFSLLPSPHAEELRALWDEFDEAISTDAAFAAALDRLQPLLHNYCTQGKAWRAHGITKAQVIQRNSHIANGAPELWRIAEAMIDDAVARGYLAP